MEAIGNPVLQLTVEQDEVIGLFEAGKPEAAQALLNGNEDLKV